MNRLTEKSLYEFDDEYGYAPDTSDRKIRNKLGKLEDIEEELGIELVVLFKALYEGVYIIDSDENIIFEEPMLSFNQEKNTNLYVLDGVTSYPPNKLCKSYSYYFKDYGKTWALTKEELEDE